MAHATRKSIARTHRAARKGEGAMPWTRAMRAMPRLPWRGMVKIALLLAVLGWGVAVVAAGKGHEKAAQMATAKFHEFARTHGFAVRDVLIEGRDRLDYAWLQHRLANLPGQSVFAVDIAAIQKDIEAQSWVASARVQRLLPDRIKIVLTERAPFVFHVGALETQAQNPARATLMDENGVRIGVYEREFFPGLMLVEGDGAVLAAKDFLPLLRAEKDLLRRVRRAAFIGGRRWDLVLDNGVRVKLPQDDPGLALRRLMKAQEEEALLDKAVRIIDLRQHGRIILETKAKEFSSGEEGDNI